MREDIEDSSALLRVHVEAAQQDLGEILSLLSTGTGWDPDWGDLWIEKVRGMRETLSALEGELD